MKKIIISLLLILPTILSLTSCISFKTPTTETTTAEVITLPAVVTTEVSTTEEIITSAPVIETTTIEEITTAIQELTTNEYITLAPEITTVMPETTTETTIETIETWKNEKIGLSFDGGDKYKLYNTKSISNVTDISLFESIGCVPEMFAMNGTTTAIVITGTDLSFNSSLIVSAMKMATSFSDSTKYTGSRTENIAGEKYDAVSMDITTDSGVMKCDYLIREEGNTLVMIMLTYEDSVAKADVISRFN